MNRCGQTLQKTRSHLKKQLEVVTLDMVRLTLYEATKLFPKDVGQELE